MEVNGEPAGDAENKTNDTVVKKCQLNGLGDAAEEKGEVPQET